MLYRVVECLKECGVDVEEIQKEHASIIAVGNQNVHNLPFWSNIYGHDTDDEELAQIYTQLEI